MISSWVMDDTPKRELEAEVMALLEQIIGATEAAQGLIQDDGKVTGRRDREGIRDRMMHIRALSLEVDQLLHP